MTPSPHARNHARKASSGFILVAVLWIIAALAGLVSVYAVYLSNTAIAATVRDDALRARGLATAGVELAAYHIVSQPKERRPTRGELVFRMGKARVTAAFQNETARIDLNTASKELLAGLLGVLGAQPADAQRHAERIVAWRAKSGPATQAGEASLYREAGLDYGPRGGPFAHVDELWLVLGLPPALVERALPYLTVFSGRAEVHARDADPVVLAALPGASPERLAEFLGQRDALPTGSPAAFGPPTGGPAAGGPTGGGRPPALPGTTLEGGEAVRVTVRADFDNGRVVTSEAVILLRDVGDDPYRVLSWRDDIDAPAPLSRQRPEPRR